MSLHMYEVTRSIWRFLCTQFGTRFFEVLEWILKTEYQGRGTPHWHIAAWVICWGPRLYLAGRTGQGDCIARVASSFVKFRALLFHCEIDVQVGNWAFELHQRDTGKDHDSVDVGLGEYVQRDDHPI